MCEVALLQQLESVTYCSDNDSHRLRREQHPARCKGDESELRSQQMLLLRSLSYVPPVPMESRKGLLPERFPTRSKRAQMLLHLHTNIEIELTDTQIVVFPDSTQEHRDNGIDH